MKPTREWLVNEAKTILANHAIDLAQYTTKVEFDEGDAMVMFRRRRLRDAFIEVGLLLSEEGQVLAFHVAFNAGQPRRRRKHPS